MPCDYRKYSEDWKWLSAQLRKDVGNKCELCYAPNGAFINRIQGAEYPWYKVENAKPSDDLTRVVLTVHHIDFNKKNNVRQNLLVLCQRCHLRLDLHHHMKNRKAARQNNAEATLQLTTQQSTQCVCDMPEVLFPKNCYKCGGVLPDNLLQTHCAHL